MKEKNSLTRKITQDNFTTEKIDVIKNNLLGSYDDEGNYFIAPQIVSELLSLDKHRKSSFGNSMFCIGDLLGYGEIVFELSFKDKTGEGQSAISSLYVLENVDKINGYLQNTIKTKLADFTDDVENFIEESYTHFNISLSDAEDAEDGMSRKLLDDLENEDSFILAKKQYSLLMDKLLEEKFLDAYGRYFTYRISALTKLDNSFSNDILDRFNSEYALIEKVFFTDKNYKMLNELLDKCIEEVSGTKEEYIAQEKDFMEKTSPALETFVDSVNKLNEKFSDKALKLLDKDDREKVEDLLEEVEAHNDDLQEDKSHKKHNGTDDNGVLEKPVEIVQEERNAQKNTLKSNIIVPELFSEEEEEEKKGDDSEKDTKKEKEDKQKEEPVVQPPQTDLNLQTPKDPVLNTEEPEIIKEPEVVVKKEENEPEQEVEVVEKEDKKSPSSVEQLMKDKDGKTPQVSETLKETNNPDIEDEKESPSKQKESENLEKDPETQEKTDEGKSYNFSEMLDYIKQDIKKEREELAKKEQEIQESESKEKEEEKVSEIEPTETSIQQPDFIELNEQVNQQPIIDNLEEESYKRKLGQELIDASKMLYYPLKEKEQSQELEGK